MKMLRAVLGYSALLLTSGLTAKAAIDRTKPPETPPIPAVMLPDIQYFDLPNGLHVVAAEDRRFPLTSFRVAFLAGSKYDPADLPGLSDSVAALLNQGTTTRTAQQIAEQAADIGGQITAASHPDVLVVSGTCLSDGTPRLLSLLADVTRNASFPEDEVQLQKQNRLQKLRAERSEADYIGREALHAALFEEHPYSHIGPTEKALERLDKKSVEAFRDSYLVPNNAWLVIVGQLPPADQLKSMIVKEFGSWQQKTVPPYHPPAIPENKKRMVLVDRPGSVQANIFSSHLSPTYGSPEFFPLAVGNMILGGGANSRLFLDIREKRGFAYDAHTEPENLKETAVVSAVTEVRNEVADPALEALAENLQAISKENVGALELSDAKNAYAGTFLLRLERQSALADQLVRIQTMGLPKDYLETFTTHVRSVEPDQIRKTGKYWNPEDATLVVVGDAQKIQKALEKRGTVTVTKPFQ